MSAPSIVIAGAVDAEHTTQRTVQRVLTGLGARVDVADDLEQAARSISHSAPVLVVVDGAAMSAPGAVEFSQPLARDAPSSA